MARNRTVRLHLIDGTVVVLPESLLNTFGVSESPTSIVGALMSGSYGAVVSVKEDETGASLLINPQFIVKAAVEYT